MKGQRGASMGGMETSSTRRRRDARRRRAQDAAWAGRSGPVTTRFVQTCGNCDSPWTHRVKLFHGNGGSVEVHSCLACYSELQAMVLEETGLVLPDCDEKCDGG
jgi:hypothetical protein